jgi:nifR3 family TIM-barrel protein
MKIGNVEIRGRAVLAPLAGITDLPFRLLCKEQGAALVYTEMISAEGLIRKQPATVDILESRPEEKPVSFQLFGKKPDSMAEAARIICGRGADIIDINMGCPVKKVVRGGSGAALLKDLNEAVSVIKAVVSASSVPVTIKVRAGWSPTAFVAAELARAARRPLSVAVAGAWTVPRGDSRATRTGQPSKALKDAVSIPVMGTGMS